MVAAKLKDGERQDFDAAPGKAPAEWAALREEARPLLRELGIWRGELAPVRFARSSGLT